MSKQTCTWMFTAASCTSASNKKQSKSLFTWWTDKMWWIPSTEYYLAIKKEQHAQHEQREAKCKTHNVWFWF